MMKHQVSYFLTHSVYWSVSLCHKLTELNTPFCLRDIDLALTK